MQISLSKMALTLLCLFLFTGFNSALATEKEELTRVIKQLTQVKESLLRSEIVSGTEEANRYHFNYEAAQNDINHIIQGIESYLSPTRSQPRLLDLPAVNGDYQDEVTYE